MKYHLVPGNREKWCQSAIIIVVSLFLCLPVHLDTGCAYAAGRAGLRNHQAPEFAPLPPMQRFLSGTALNRRKYAENIRNANEFLSSENHFRIFWGNDIDPWDANWHDTDGNGTPQWIDVIAQALEDAHAIQYSQGFAVPYGMDRYALDVYIANTGMEILNSETGSWEKVTISSGYFALTEINEADACAWFVFNSDFSNIVSSSDEMTVLRVTAAHELFHAVQRSYYPWNDSSKISNARWDKEGWWFEASAAWMEEICEPDANDYAEYVRDFLARPDKSITTFDGNREYGASVYCGYLWMKYGGASLWQTVFENASSDGLEDSIDSALSQSGGPSFYRSVAEFWSFAAHPEDTWPDGALYKSSSAPEISQTVNAIPSDFSVKRFSPDRLGAYLIKLDKTIEKPAGLTISNVSSDSAWIAAMSAEDVTDPITKELKPGIERNLSYSGSDSYIAIVNVSETQGSQNFDLGIDEGDVNDLPDNDNSCDGDNTDSGGGSSGCFIDSAGLLFFKIP
ncbi:hypothetical protein QUF76_14635 [Desulfobacterales bacterium HSG16]|nr:hypothetical protein [Desulfobacterales bacterium HSG16]